jgi:Ca-activated chloride channel family protein
MHCSYLFYFRTFFLIFFFIIRSNCSLLDIAIQNPNDSVAVYNAGTDFFNKGDYEKAVYFLEKSQEIAKPEFIEPININKAHSLVKLQKYAEALDVYKYLLNKYQNKQAEHNIPILEEILRKQDQDKQDQDKQDQDKKSKEEKEAPKDQPKDDSDQKQDDKNRQKQDKENSSQDQQGQNNNQNQNKKNQEKEKTQENSQHQETQSQKCNNLEDKQSGKEQQAENLESLDANEQKMLNVIDSFDKQMMKLFAATHCKGAEDDKTKETGW